MRSGGPLQCSGEAYPIWKRGEPLDVIAKLESSCVTMQEERRRRRYVREFQGTAGLGARWKISTEGRVSEVAPRREGTFLPEQ